MGYKVGGGVRNQVKGRGEDVGLASVCRGVGRKFCRNLWVSLLLLYLKLEDNPCGCQHL